MTIGIEHLTLSELKSFLQEQAEDAFPSLRDEEKLNELAEKWHNHAEFCICRNAETQLVGMIAFYANQPKSKVAYIPHVYVSPKYRRRGIFIGMLNLIEKAIIQDGFSKICLEVNNSNINAKETYLKYGFEIYKEASNESIYMTKHLI